MPSEAVYAGCDRQRSTSSGRSHQAATGQKQPVTLMPTVHNQGVVSRALQQGPIAETPASDSYAKTVVCEDEVSRSKSFCLSAC